MQSCRALHAGATRATRRLPRVVGASAGLCVGVLLATSSSQAGAATLGPLATSAGLFAALATLVLIQGWPAHLPVIAWSGAAGVLLVAAAAAWAWRRAPRTWGFAAAPLNFPTSKGRVTPILPAPCAATALPAGLEVEPLLTELRLQFVRLQAAWDLADIQTLRALTTPQMRDELCFEWRDVTAPRAPNRTDVVTLYAELLGFEELDGVELASVEFSGLIREAAGEAAVPFRELWMLAKSKHDAAGWRLARQQALL